MRPPWETQGSSHKLHLQDEGRPLEKWTPRPQEFPRIRAMRMNLIWPTSCSPRKYFSHLRNRKKHVILPCVDYFTKNLHKSYGLVSRNSEVSYFKSVTSSQTESRRKSVSTQHVDILFVSEISGWHIKFKNSSSSRVLYSSAADFWEKRNAQLFTEAVEKLSQTKIFGSWCYVSRKWVNKNASWEGGLPTSNPRRLRVQGFTSGFIVSCWKSNRRLKLTLNHINHLI